MAERSFSKKRTRRIFVCLTAVCAVTLMIGTVLPISASDTFGGTGHYIGDEKAKSIALNHAGVTANRTTFIGVHLDHDDGRIVYDVEFYSGDTEYDYEIDAVSGNILEYDREAEHHAHGNTGTSESSSRPNHPPSETGSYIGKSNAKSIALSDAGLAESQVHKLKIKLDREHGKMIYEVEFKSDWKEYEYDIDATSGAILGSDIEYDD